MLARCVVLVNKRSYKEIVVSASFRDNLWQTWRLIWRKRSALEDSNSDLQH